MNELGWELPGQPKDMERDLLAYMLLHPGRAAMLGVEVSDFEYDQHRAICSVWKDLVRKNLAAGAVALIQHLQDYKPAEADLIRYVGIELIGNDPHPHEYMPMLLASVRTRRAVKEVGSALRSGQQALEDANVDITAEAARIADRVFLASRQADNWRSVGTIIDDFLGDELQAIQERTPMLIPSGVGQLDQGFGGIAREGVTLVIGESRMGKTTFLNRMAVGLCDQGYHVFLHGTETSESERLRDLVYSVARVNQVGARAVVDDHLRETIALQIDRAAAMVKRWGLEVTGSGLTIDRLISRATQLRREGGLDVLIVDYVQDFPRGRNDRGLGTVEFIMSVSQQLKDLSAELRIPVIVGAQAGKKTLDEARKKPKPGMWDAQWASKLPQDAEEVWCLFRHDVYRQEWGDQWDKPGQAGILEVYRRKSRKSAGDMVEMDFDGPTKWIGESYRGFKSMHGTH